MISDKLGFEVTVTKPWALKKDMQELLSKKVNTKELEDGILRLIEDHVEFGNSGYDNLCAAIENALKCDLVDALSDCFEPSDIVKDGRWACPS